MKDNTFTFTFEIEFRKSHTTKGDTMRKLQCATECYKSTKHPLLPCLVSVTEPTNYTKLSKKNHPLEQTI